MAEHCECCSRSRPRLTGTHAGRLYGQACAILGRELVSVPLTAKQRRYHENAGRLRKAHTRWVVMYWMARQGASQPQIAKLMGLRNHTTVLHGLRELEKRLKSSEAWYWRQLLGRLEASGERRAA